MIFTTLLTIFKGTLIQLITWLLLRDSQLTGVLYTYLKILGILTITSLQKISTVVPTSELILPHTKIRRTPNDNKLSYIRCIRMIKRMTIAESGILLLDRP